MPVVKLSRPNNSKEEIRDEITFFHSSISYEKGFHCNKRPGEATVNIIYQIT